MIKSTLVICLIMHVFSIDSIKKMKKESTAKSPLMIFAEIKYMPSVYTFKKQFSWKLIFISNKRLHSSMNVKCLISIILKTKAYCWPLPRNHIWMMRFIIPSRGCCVRGLLIYVPTRNRDTCMKDDVYMHHTVYKCFHYLNDKMGKM